MFDPKCTISDERMTPYRDENFMFSGLGLFCFDVGNDGRPADLIMRQEMVRLGNPSIDQVANEIVEISIWANGNITISPNGLSWCPNMVHLDIRDASKSFHLDLHPDELVTRPQLKAFSADGVPSSEGQ